MAEQFYAMGGSVYLYSGQKKDAVFIDLLICFVFCPAEMSVSALDFLLWVVVCFNYTCFEIEVTVSFDLSSLYLSERTRDHCLATSCQSKHYY